MWRKEKTQITNGTDYITANSIDISEPQGNFVGFFLFFSLDFIYLLRERERESWGGRGEERIPSRLLCTEHGACHGA